jgi:4-hydroxy-tetrahydrodipicolinate synthase
VDGNPAGVKALLSEMNMIENELRLPLVPIRITTMQKMVNILKEIRI